MTRIIHLGNGETFLAGATQLPAEDPRARVRRPSKMDQAAAARELRKQTEARHRLELLGAPEPAKRTYGPVNLLDRRNDQCAYPIGSKGLYCGKKAIPGKAWCEAHAAKVYA